MGNWVIFTLTEEGETLLITIRQSHQTFSSVMLSPNAEQRPIIIFTSERN